MEGTTKAISYLEKQGEQKPATDKTEQKFKVGDWIIHNDNKHIPLKIIEKIGMCYRMVDTVNYHHNILIDSINENYHLWTIQDAKAGDVLYFNDNTIVIFKDLYNATTFHSYCHIEDGVFDISEDNMPDWWEGKGFHPATKEQCEILFQKMREAGYEWDREKKELRKIDWNPQPGDTFRKKGTESPIYHLCDKLEDGIHFGFVEERENGIAGGEISIFALKNEYELVERLKPIEKVIEEEFNKITELKPSWSEEDEKYLKHAIEDFQKLGDSYLTFWVKSLKGRVQPKATFDFSTLKTFEKVLVRHPHCPWHPAFFSLYRKECATAPFCVVGENPYGSSYEQCVPFIGNEHLAHTIDPAPAYYGFKN